MGAWGYKIMDNDSAMDAHDDFEGYTKDGMSKQEVFEKMKEYIRKDSDDLYTLAFAQIQIEQIKKVDNDIYEEVILAINRELQGINNWRRPKERKQHLIEFKEKIEATNKREE